MKEQLITFNTAVLAKEKGFNWRNIEILEVKSKSAFLDNTTQSLLAKWLRDVHDKYITLTFIRVGEADSSYTVDIYCWRKWKNYKVKNVPDFATYEEALEEGLFEALKLIP